MPVSVFCYVCNHGNNNNCIKAVFMLIKKVVKEIVVLENYFRQLWFPWQKKLESAEIIEFGNHGNKQNCIKVSFFTLIRMGATITTNLEYYLGQLWFP